MSEQTDLAQKVAAHVAAREMPEAMAALKEAAGTKGMSVQFVAGVCPDTIVADGDRRRILCGCASDGPNNSVSLFLLRIGLGTAAFAVDIAAIWPREQAIELIVPVLEKFCAEGARPGLEEFVLEGTIMAARDCERFEKHRSLGLLSERIAILCALYANPVPLAPIFHLSEKAFARPAGERRRILNRYIERLCDLGMEMVDIRDHFLECLAFNAERRSMESVLRLAGAKCFDRSVGRDPKLERVLREKYLRRFWTQMEKAEPRYPRKILTFALLVRMGMAGLPQDREMFIASLVAMLAQGRIRQAWEIIDKIGDVGALGFYDSSVHPDIEGGSGRSPRDCHRDRAKGFLESLVPQAYNSTAHPPYIAALVNCFGPDACLPPDLRIPESERGERTERSARYWKRREGIWAACVNCAQVYEQIPMGYEDYYEMD